MNHIYKVVWSKVRGCYVVVAEIARSNGKTRSQKVVAVLGTALISSMLFTGGGLLTAEAAQGQAFGDSTTASGANSIAAGNTTTASGQESIALGTHNTASGKWSVAFGGTSIQQTFRNHGKNYFVYQIGDKTYYKNENDYFSTEDNMKFTGDASTATAVMVNAGNTASGDASVAFGQNTQAKSLGSVAFGMGTQAGAEDGKGGQNSIAFGNYTKALGGRSVAFGEYTIANYNDSVAFGNDTRALSTGATAFGNRTRALSSYSTAWGNATVAADEESTAWGSDTIAGAKLDDNGAVTNIYTYKNNPDDKNEQPKTATEKMDVHGNLAYTQNGSTVGVRQMDIGGNTEKHDYVVLDGQDGNTYVRDYQGSLWRVTVSADGKTATVDTTVGDNGKVYNNNSKAGTVGSKATTTVNGTEVAITPDSVLKKPMKAVTAIILTAIKMPRPSATRPKPPATTPRPLAMTPRQRQQVPRPLARQRRLRATMLRPSASALQLPASRQPLSAARQLLPVTMPPPSARAAQLLAKHLQLSASVPLLRAGTPSPHWVARHRQRMQQPSATVHRQLSSTASHWAAIPRPPVPSTVL